MLHIVDHPLIKLKLSIMRDEKTKSKEFRENLNEISSLLSYEVFKDCKVHNEKETFTTPTGSVLPKVKLDLKIVLVAILRAGVGMLDGVRNMIPTARVGHIGMYRDEETLQPHEYYYKLPDVPKDESLILIVDPMLATGGSAIAAIQAIKSRGFKHIRLMCLVGCPEGVKAVEEAFPDVDIYLAAVDEKLNEHGYIIPGLGDAGDRIFGTK